KSRVSVFGVGGAWFVVRGSGLPRAARRFTSHEPRITYHGQFTSHEPRITYHGPFTSHEPLTTILIHLDAGAANDLGPLGDVVVQVLPEFARRHRQRFRALLVPGFLHVGPFDDFRNLRIEPVDHRLRRSSRRHEADPDGGFITRHAGLGHRRHVGQDRRALLAGGCQRSYPPALRGRRHGGDRIHHHLHLPAHHAGARVAAALVGNVHDVHVRHRLEKLAGHVVRRPGARG